MNYLGIGITLLVIGLVLSLLPTFGVIAGPLIYIGWVLVAIGIILGIVHFVMANTGGRVGRGRSL